MYDLCVRWNIKDVYRENIAFVKLAFGNMHGSRQQMISVGAVMHGTSKNRHHNFLGFIDGIDWSIAGHQHSLSYHSAGRLRVDRIHGTISHAPCCEIVVDSNLNPGGYGIQKEYGIPAVPELQYIELSYYRDSTNSRRMHRVMNFHSIQIST